MMERRRLLVTEVIGSDHEGRFAGRAVEQVLVDSSDATKRRLRLVTDTGTDVAIDLPRGSFLDDGAVIADDGTRIVVVRRKPEPALVVRFGASLTREQLTTAAARIGHAFGNQHTPLDVSGEELRVPITTSADVAVETVRALGLDGVIVDVTERPLACQAPTGTRSHTRDHGHSHQPGAHRPAAE
jgi:urease accessory protein